MNNFFSSSGSLRERRERQRRAWGCTAPVLSSSHSRIHLCPVMWICFCSSHCPWGALSIWFLETVNLQMRVQRPRELRQCGCRQRSWWRGCKGSPAPFHTHTLSFLLRRRGVIRKKWSIEYSRMHVYMSGALGLVANWLYTDSLELIARGKYQLLYLIYVWHGHII